MPSKVSPADTYSAFTTEEGFKAVAKRLGVSPNTLRGWWVSEFGQEAFDARGKRLQAKAASAQAKSMAGKPRVMQEVTEPCSRCSSPVALNVLQRAKLKHILCVPCDEVERGVDCHCPVCGFGCVGEKGLSGHMARPQHGDPDAHAAYLQGKEDRAWEGKTEGADFVRCLLCGHRGARIDRHLQADHGLDVGSYRAQFPDAGVQTDALRQIRSDALRARPLAVAGSKKTISCPSCGVPYDVAFSIGVTRTDARRPDLRCPTCKAKDEGMHWASLVEGDDYVTCQGCGYRAENLTSHVQNAHPEWVGCYPGQMVATHSAVRDKSALKGRTLSAETRAKMSASAGWNRGLTKETDERVAHAAEAMKGREVWNTGLTKEDHPSLRATSEKLQGYRGTARPWSNGLKADLSTVDFTPYLDETGAVDRQMMAVELGFSEPTITKYMEKIGLRLSSKYMDARVARGVAEGRFHEMSRLGNEPRIVRLTPEQLEPFKLKNGKVSLAKAMRELGHVYTVIKRECDRLGIPTYTRLVQQTLCLDAVSKILGGASYEQEWHDPEFLNPLSGHRFRFDGFFPSVGPHGLLVEFHGLQHWVYPNPFHKTEADFQAGQERDRQKAEQVEADGRFLYLVLREDEPYADPAYLRGRYLDLID